MSRGSPPRPSACAWRSTTEGRVAYAELLSDERKETCVAFMGRARDLYLSLGVEAKRAMTDNGLGYRSRLSNEWFAASGIAHRYTRPYGP